MAQLRVLVVDDSASFRTALAACIDRSGLARVVAHAGNGDEALAAAAQSRPDVVTLDVEMPVRGGLETVSALRQALPSARVVMVSAHTRSGAELTLRALSLGAYDFITKPSHKDHAENQRELKESVARVLGLLATDVGTPPASKPQPQPPPHDRGAASTAGRRPQARVDLIAIGSSTGGPAALATLIPRLPASLPVPVVVVQHMPELFTAELAASLAQTSKLRVVEATDRAVLETGTVYIARGGRHLRVAGTRPSAVSLELSEEPPEHFCRPAADVLFRSVATLYGPAAAGVILTGLGKDGAAGLAQMRARGAVVVAQSPDSCTAPGMPRAAIAAGAVDRELGLEAIAEELVQLTRHLRVA